MFSSRPFYPAAFNILANEGLFLNDRAMKIATWNVNSIKARLNHALGWIDQAQPDVLMLQELKGQDFPADAFIERGYAIEAKGQKAYNGVAILSRLPMVMRSDDLPGFETDDQARFIEAEIAGMRCLNIYVPNGNPVDTEKFPYKLKWLGHLVDYARDLRRQQVPFLIGGDFNIIPEDIDCYNPKTWEGDALFKPESRSVYRTLCNLGLTDALRVFHAEPGVYTFWDYFAGSWGKR